jgi:predicted glutamine amidotransferase
MCLIISKQSGIGLPKPEYLRSGACTNRDGLGVAYHKEGVDEVVIKKDFKDVLDLIAWIPENITVNDSLLVHFRFATSGLKDEGNRHPFPITKNLELIRKTNLVCQEAIVHNGVFTGYNDLQTYNDTQKFIFDILADEEVRTNLKNPAIKKLIENYLHNSKIAILLHTGEILYFGDFLEEDGLQFSNRGYKWGWSKYDRSDYGKGWWSDKEKDKNKNITHTHTPVTDAKEKDIFYCEHCKLSEASVKEIKEIWYKKVKLVLCKNCRKLLGDGRLEWYVNCKKNKMEEKNKTALMCYSDSTMCYKCLQSGKKADMHFVNQTMLYMCKTCQSIEEQKKNWGKCEMCNIWLKKTELQTYEDIEVCGFCYKQIVDMAPPGSNITPINAN